MQHKENKITQRIILSLIASMITMSLSAQTTPKRPSLVVGIMIDGLNQEYIDKLLSPENEKKVKLTTPVPTNIQISFNFIFSKFLSLTKK